MNGKEQDVLNVKERGAQPCISHIYHLVPSFCLLVLISCQLSSVFFTHRSSPSFHHPSVSNLSPISFLLSHASLFFFYPLMSPISFLLSHVSLLFFSLSCLPYPINDEKRFLQPIWLKLSENANQFQSRTLL